MSPRLPLPLIKKICAGIRDGDARSQLWKIPPSLYLEKRDFVTHYYTNLSQKNIKIGANWVLFWSNFPKYTQFCKLSGLGLEQKPTHQYTKNYEKPS